MLKITYMERESQNEYMYMNNWFPVPYTWNIINELCSNKN